MQRSEAERADLKRTRTAKACMHCRRRRIKCTGESPCASCVKLGRSCVYECGPKKPRISHKGVITTLKAENQRLRADLRNLRMASGMAGVSAPAGSTQAGTAPKAEELPFVDAYLAFEEEGLFPLVGRHRFAAALSHLRSKKSSRGAVGPTLSREDSALYFAMLAVGASLRRQDVPAMSYAARVRTILSESFDAPSETMVRVSLLLALAHNAKLDVAKEACYLSTALQMLAVLNRVTGKPVPPSLVATAGAMCSISDGPLPFTTPKDMACADPRRALACLITQVAGVLMHEGDSHTAEVPDFADLLRATTKAVSTLADATARGLNAPSAFPILVHGLHAICLFRMARPVEGTAALRRCMAAFPAAHSAAGARVWAHPMMAFVVRHVAILATTAGLPGGDGMANQVHHIAMAWPRAAVYFRGLQSDLRAFDDGFCACVDGTEVGLAVPCGGSPSLLAPSAPAVPSLSLRGDTFGDSFDMCLDMVGCGDAVASYHDAKHPDLTAAASVSPNCAPADKAREQFSFVQMVTLALGKPFNTTPAVIGATAASTRTLVGAPLAARAGAGGGSPRSPSTHAPFASSSCTVSNPASSPVSLLAPPACKQLVHGGLVLPEAWETALLDDPVKLEPRPSAGMPARRNSLGLLGESDRELDLLLLDLTTPDDLVPVSLA